MIGRPSALAFNSVPEAAGGVETLVVLTVPDPIFMCGHLPGVYASHGREAPARVRCFAGVEESAEIVREDEQTPSNLGAEWADVDVLWEALANAGRALRR